MVVLPPWYALWTAFSAKRHVELRHAHGSTPACQDARDRRCVHEVEVAQGLATLGHERRDERPMWT